MDGLYFRRMLRLLSIVLSMVTFGEIFANDMKTINIGILTTSKATSVQAIIEQGAYRIWADGKVLSQMNPKQRFTAVWRANLIELHVQGKVLGSYRRIRLEAADSTGIFRLFVLSPNRIERVYDDDLHLGILGKHIKMVNRVDLEKYVAGVVEAESGKEKHLEFYKVQSIISRTYALSNARKHLHEGFNLNDMVDCQVYHGRARWEPIIWDAVMDTRGKVLVDSEMKLITAAFHSNSGGETVPSDWVWSVALPYLSPRKDEFSVAGTKYEWHKTVLTEAWLNYLKKKWGYDTTQPELREQALTFSQPVRQVYFLAPEHKIPLKDVRKDWSLRSTFFDVIHMGDSVRFTGRGFGHGIGLSQEGAMRMADLGFEYTEILHFYYTNVHIVERKALTFYRQ
jgi:stage II sporulation protein D